MLLLLIRHAEPVRAVAETAEGSADPGLHERGVLQAGRLAEWLTSERLDALYSSPLRRARETAEAIASRHRLDVTVDGDLAEYDQNASEYIPFEELRAAKDPRYFDMLAGKTEGYGVDPDEFRARAVDAVERVIAKHRGESVAMVCHGGIINAYTGSVIGSSKLLWFQPGYTSVSRVAANSEGVRTIVALNETCHLRGLEAQ